MIERTKQQSKELGFSSAIEFRKLWGLDEVPISNLTQIAEEHGVIILKFPNNQNVSGLSFKKLDKGQEVNCVYVNSDDPVGRTNFSLAHELYHLYYEPTDKPQLTSINRKDPIEESAESFAGKLLIPRGTLIIELRKRRFSSERRIKATALYDLQKCFGVTFQALLFAIDGLRNTEFKNFVPLNINGFKKYYRVDWDKLNEMILKHDPNNLLNSKTKEYYLSPSFEKYIEENYHAGRIDKGRAIDLLEFFEQKLNLEGETNGEL